MSERDTQSDRTSHRLMEVRMKRHDRVLSGEKASNNTMRTEKDEKADSSKKGVVRDTAEKIHTLSTGVSLSRGLTALAKSRQRPLTKIFERER